MRTFRVACVLALLGGLAGCATKQLVALDCVPHEVTVFIDGRQLQRGTPSVELETDEPHTFFFKGSGYEPQLVVLDSVEGENGRLLAPTGVCTEAAFVPLRPGVRMEVDPGELEAPPGP